MIKFWFSPNLRQIIEYQAIFYRKRIRVFLQFHPQYKNKTNPEIRLKKSDFSIEIDLAIVLERLSVQENRPVDAAQQLASYSPRFLHSESFSEPDALTRVVWIINLASEAGAISGADLSGCHGLTCPRALTHLILGRISCPKQQWNRENISDAKTIVRKSVSGNSKSVRRTKWQADFQSLDSHWNSRTQHNDNYVRTI